MYVGGILNYPRHMLVLGWMNGWLSYTSNKIHTDWGFPEIGAHHCISRGLPWTDGTPWKYPKPHWNEVLSTRSRLPLAIKAGRPHRPLHMNGILFIFCLPLRTHFVRQLSTSVDSSICSANKNLLSIQPLDYCTLIGIGSIIQIEVLLPNLSSGASSKAQ